MRIGVIGGGTVGRATARTWLEHCDEVRVWDLATERRTCKHFSDAISCDLVFVCLPETVLDSWFNVLTSSEKVVNFVLKSTVPIGTTRRLCERYNLPNLVHSPEFLTARCALTDAMLPARNIVGVPFDSSDDAYPFMPTFGTDELPKLYRSRFPGVQTLVMSSDESEAVKLICNAFFAVKIAFFNETRSLTDKLGLDWGAVLAGVLSDGRISHNHTKVPGPDGKRGFGGACLPKDLIMFRDCLHKAEIGGNLIEAAIFQNQFNVCGEAEPLQRGEDGP
jgi:UDP-glucose 6-dehydrogenase